MKDKVMIDEETGKKFLVSFKEIPDPTKPPKYPKVAVVIGHTDEQTGFTSGLVGKEWEFWHKYAYDNLTDLCNIQIHDSSIRSYTKRQIDTANELKEMDLVFELHFNSYDGTAEGAHAMYYAGSEIGKKIANTFTKLMEGTFKIEQDYNVPVKNEKVRGGAFIMKQKGTAVLLEPFFADNKDDIKKFNTNINFFKNIIERLIEVYYDNK